jgi:hypothetical protein
VTIEEATVGAAVVYRSHPGAPAEDGDIVRVSDRFVFVRFVGDRHPKACRAEDLTVAGGAS